MQFFAFNLDFFYTRQIFLHRHRLWCQWQIWGMIICTIARTDHGRSIKYGAVTSWILTRWMNLPLLYQYYLLLTTLEIAGLMFFVYKGSKLLFWKHHWQRVVLLWKRLEAAYSSYQEQITQLEGAKKSVDIRHGQKLGGPGVLNHWFESMLDVCHPFEKRVASTNFHVVRHLAVDHHWKDVRADV